MIKFGPSGNSASFTEEGFTKTEQAAEWVKAKGLTAYEYSFGRGVRMSEQTAITIGEAFDRAGVTLSVHAPYYINFATLEEEKASASVKYLLDSAEMLRLMGGKRVIFHPAAQGKASRESAVNLTKERLKAFCDYVYANALDDLLFCPETMGKLGQIGTLEEIVELCKIDKIYLPTIDFGHINAREGGSLKSKRDYGERLDYMISELGFERVEHFHVHFSKIQYGDKGEVRHLTFADDVYGPEFPPLAEALKERNLTPCVICESAGTQAEDAVSMMNSYNSLS